LACHTRLAALSSLMRSRYLRVVRSRRSPCSTMAHRLQAEVCLVHNAAQRYAILVQHTSSYPPIS
jgi:hypothetical protein